MNLITPTPRVSVLLPVRNGLPYLREAITGVLAQTFTDFELLVIDDGSDDGSALVARGFGDPRIRVFAARGHGVAHALNLGLLAARGEIVARQDADDRSHPERLARQLACLDAMPDVQVVASRVAFIDAGGRPFENAWTHEVSTRWDVADTPEAIAALLPITCCLVHGTIIARRSTLLVAGGYDESLDVAQDYDLWLRLLPDRCFARVPAALYDFRVHAMQVSASRADAQTDAAIAAKLRYLRRVARVPPAGHAVLIGEGRGAELYRRALSAAALTEATLDEPWDVAIFTDLTRLDEDVERAERRISAAATTRVGNFLVVERRIEAAA